MKKGDHTTCSFCGRNSPCTPIDRGHYNPNEYIKNFWTKIHDIYICSECTIKMNPHRVHRHQTESILYIDFITRGDKAKMYKQFKQLNNMKILESFKKNIQQFSRDNKDIVFTVYSTNNEDKNFYYLKNGVFAIQTGFNTQYDFACNKVNISKLSNDGIYKASEIERTEQNIKTYNI